MIVISDIKKLWTSILLLRCINGFTISPVGVAYMCLNDVLMLTCVTDEEFLEWNVTIPSQNYDHLRLISSSETRDIPSLTVNHTTFSFHRESRMPLNITLTITNATADMQIFCIEYYLNDSDSVNNTLVATINVLSNLVITESLFDVNNASIGVSWDHSPCYNILMVTPRAAVIGTNGNATVTLRLSYNVAYNLTVLGTLYGCSSSLNLFYVNCGPPPTPTNGYIIPGYTSTQEGAEVNVSCISRSQQQDSYTMLMTCSHNGSWQPNPSDVCNQVSVESAPSESLIVGVSMSVSITITVCIFVVIIVLCVFKILWRRSQQFTGVDTLPLETDI